MRRQCTGIGTALGTLLLLCVGCNHRVAPDIVRSSADTDGDAIASDGDRPIPGGDAHSPGGDAHSPGGDTHSPGGDAHSPGGDTHSPGGDTHSPGDSGAPPPSACADILLPSNLASLTATLDTHPPELWPEHESRTNAVLALDVFLQEVDVNEPDPWKLSLVRQASALQEMRSTQPAPGNLAIWQLYNMGFVVRSEDLTACFDVFANGLEVDHECAIESMLGIVDECDILFVSHFHGDHASPLVIQAFLDRSKPVIATKQTWDYWIGVGQLSEADRARTQHLQRLTPEAAHHIQTVALSGGRTLDVVVYPGHQGEDADNNVYVVYMTDTITFAHAGDESSSPTEYLWRPEVKNDHEIDFYVYSLISSALVSGFEPDVLIPSHRNELHHVPGPSRLSWAGAYSSFEPYLGARQGMVLTWGELSTHWLGAPGSELWERRFEAEIDLSHLTGTAIPEGWRATVEDVSGYMSYGPYVEDLPHGVGVAEFWLRTDDVTAPNCHVATLDVFNAASSNRLARRSIYRHDFHTAWTWQPYRLRYETRSTVDLEIEVRVYYHGCSLLDLDRVDVYRRSYEVANSSNQLLPGDDLAAGESLFSADGRFQLVMQHNCNLVLYWRSNENEVLWHSGTAGAGDGCHLALQAGDGHLVLYDNDRVAVWANNTLGGDAAVMQNDGNFVVYAEGTPLWSSGTGGL